MEQTFIIQSFNEFNIKHIFECGQCFRWNKEEDESYTGVIYNNIINVKQNKNQIIFTGLSNNIKDICTEYFDLSRDYKYIKEELSEIDNDMKTSVLYGQGIRILHQDLWETLISFIISANNNIPRIKTTIERICKKYGKNISYKGKEYFTFPTPEELLVASIQDLRDLGLGFRDKRIFETTQLVLKNKINLEEIKKEENIEKLRETLLEIPGVGPKVADCVMLFALQKFEAFPIDVWVRRVMSELYFNTTEENISIKKIDLLAKQKYGNLAGLAQQYLFYWKREKGA